MSKIEEEIKKIELTKYNYLQDKEQFKRFENSVMGKLNLLENQFKEGREK